MFAVFAVWAAFGFAFPTEPLPLALNVISKILCFDQRDQMRWIERVSHHEPCAAAQAGLHLAHDQT
jgi:hypothetical protein